jgi:UDP-glucose 4-epimerase
MEEKNVLITGGLGFIGGRLATTLASENDVTVFDNAASGTPPADATLVQGDIRDEETVADIVADTDADVIFHEAAMVSVNKSVANPKESHAVNAMGTLNVLEAARDNDSRVVLASSAAVYGDPEETPVSETHRLEPTSPYGLDKLASDHYARLYNDLYGLKAAAIRYFNVYGPGQTGGDYAGVIEVFLEQARSGDPITVHGDGQQTRDFVHVDDVVQANIAAAETDAVGKPFNIGTGESVTIHRLAELIRDAVGSDSEIDHTEPREGDIRHSCANIERARDELGYEPEFDLEEGLQTLIESR